MVTVDDLRKICLGLAGIKEDVKWENHVCFNVGGKMYLVIFPEDVSPYASFKVRAELFDETITKTGLQNMFTWGGGTIGYISMILTV